MKDKKMTKKDQLLSREKILFDGQINDILAFVTFLLACQIKKRMLVLNKNRLVFLFTFCYDFYLKGYTKASTTTLRIAIQRNPV